MKKLINMGIIITLIILGLFGVTFQLSQNTEFAIVVTLIVVIVAIITAAIKTAATRTDATIETAVVNLTVFLLTTMVTSTSMMITVMIEAATTINLAIDDIFLIAATISLTVVAIIMATVETSKKTFISKTKISLVFAVEISVAVVATTLILKYAA